MRYELIIYWSREDNAFLVEVPELPGCPADLDVDCIRQFQLAGPLEGACRSAIPELPAPRKPNTK